MLHSNYLKIYKNINICTTCYHLSYTRNRKQIHTAYHWLSFLGVHLTYCGYVANLLKNLKVCMHTKHTCRNRAYWYKCYSKYSSRKRRYDAFVHVIPASYIWGERYYRWCKRYLLYMKCTYKYTFIHTNRSNSPKNCLQFIHTIHSLCLLTDDSLHMHSRHSANVYRCLSIQKGYTSKWCNPPFVFKRYPPKSLNLFEISMRTSHIQRLN